MRAELYHLRQCVCVRACVCNKSAKKMFSETVYFLYSSTNFRKTFTQRSLYLSFYLRKKLHDAQPMNDDNERDENLILLRYANFESLSCTRV